MGLGEPARLAAFGSVKKKLTFDEDFMTLLPYEAGLAQSDSNPFLKMLEREDAIPQFQHSTSETRAESPVKKQLVKATILSLTQQRDLGRSGKHFAMQHDALEQLDGVLTSMFKLLQDDVEPFIEDQQARMALKSYKSLTTNLLKSLKIKKQRNQDQ